MKITKPLAQAVPKHAILAQLDQQLEHCPIDSMAEKVPLKAKLEAIDGQNAYDILSVLSQQASGNGPSYKVNSAVVAGAAGALGTALAYGLGAGAGGVLVAGAVSGALGLVGNRAVRRLETERAQQRELARAKELNILEELVESTAEEPGAYSEEWNREFWKTAGKVFFRQSWASVQGVLEPGDAEKVSQSDMRKAVDEVGDWLEYPLRQGSSLPTGTAADMISQERDEHQKNFLARVAKIALSPEGEIPQEFIKVRIREVAPPTWPLAVKVYQDLMAQGNSLSDTLMAVHMAMFLASAALERGEDWTEVFIDKIEASSLVKPPGGLVYQV